jgi:hypothetical protein
MILWPHVCCTRTRTGVDMLPAQTLSPTATLHCSTDMSSEMKTMVESMNQVHTSRATSEEVEQVAIGVLSMTNHCHYRSARDPKWSWPPTPRSDGDGLNDDQPCSSGAGEEALGDATGGGKDEFANRCEYLANHTVEVSSTAVSHCVLIRQASSSRQRRGVS